MPASIACLTILSTVIWSSPPSFQVFLSPKVIAPRDRTEAYTPVLPMGVYFILPMRIDWSAAYLSLRAAELIGKVIGGGSLCGAHNCWSNVWNYCGGPLVSLRLPCVAVALLPWTNCWTSERLRLPESL